MIKVVVEVGSTNTKVDLFENNKVKRLEEITILFKKNYYKNKQIDKNDFEKLVDCVNKLKTSYKNVYVCGTSIFRELEDEERKAFWDSFYNATKIDFHIISSEDENELTVLGATRKVSEKVGVFVGGGGSTEIAVFDKLIIEKANSSFGVMDVMEKFPDLGDDLAKTSLEEVMAYIKKNLVLPSNTCDVLILAGGGHEFFVRGSKIKCEKNILYNDDCAPIMMDIETRILETKRFYESISLEEIKMCSNNPDWWFATRAMCAFVLVVAESLKVKYIVPTNISMIYGILEKNKSE